ncbi:MAG: hypothetical protein GY768_21740 [Planctomycetaceae bacterium]|nr:hypothetical protein [Planctomycetaceae bacterium]
MHGNEDQFLEGVSGFLGTYFLLLSLMNGVASYYCWQSLKKSRLAGWWLALSMLFLIMSPFAYAGVNGSPATMKWIGMPTVFKDFVDTWLANAVAYTLGTTALLIVLYVGRRFFVNPVVAWLGLNLSLLFMGMSIVDPEFAAIVTKPDNVPIVAMVFLLGFFTWLATYRSVQNDDRMEQGLEPLEALEKEKVLVWPDLVYTEMICMIALTAILILWAIGLTAPLEEPASSVKTPNPSKAPWYFLGLQEMLVYFDPWMAGVVLPSLVVVGLMAIPFLDFNKEGNGYYTIKQRRFAYIIFQLGFLELWVTLIILGTFLRGPNWNFFGPYEFWDAHKVEALNSIDLSQYFWIKGLGRALPKAPEGATMLTQIAFIVYRESPGILLTLAYFVVIPPMLAVTLFRSFFVKMGFVRYMVMSNLLLFMALLPLKMVLRWTLNLKYIISIPEYFLNL